MGRRPPEIYRPEAAQATPARLTCTPQTARIRGLCDANYVNPGDIAHAGSFVSVRLRGCWPGRNGEKVRQRRFFGGTFRWPAGQTGKRDLLAGAFGGF
jgi:hypothetical protein